MAFLLTALGLLLVEATLERHSVAGLVLLPHGYRRGKQVQQCNMD